MAAKEIHHSKTSFGSSTDGSSPPSESFALETKFIVLNFLSRNPHERHPGCVYSTSSSAGSDSAQFPFHSNKPHHSFPASPRKRTIAQKLGQLDSSFRSSEDNVSYKYQKEQKKLQVSDSSNEFPAEHSGPSKPFRTSSADNLIHDRRHFKSLSFDHGLNRGRYFLESESSPLTEDRTTASLGTPFTNYQVGRLESEISNDASNLSYTSDADDEYESTTSSLFSSFNDGSQVNKQNDQSQSGKRLYTLKSESDLDTDQSTVVGDTSAEAVREGKHDDSSVYCKDSTAMDSQATEEKQSKCNQTVIIDQQNQELDELDSSVTLSSTNGIMNEQMIMHGSLQGYTDSGSISVDMVSSSTTLKLADRSKLHLIIRDQRLWEEEQNNQIQHVMASVEDEVTSQFECLESEVEEAIKRNIISPEESPFISPLSPHTEAAMTLARIGDEIKDYYGDRLTAAVSGLCDKEQDSFSYEDFRCVASSIVDQVLPGWRQVALLLVFGQSVAWRVAEFGYREFGDLVNNTVRLISEFAADFITSQGGWNAVVSYDSSPQYSSPDNQSPRDGLEQINIGTGVSTQNHVIFVQNKSSGDHVTFVPPPDESACDNVIGNVVSGSSEHACSNRGTISLADILVTLSPSGETKINNMVFEASNESSVSHVIVKPATEGSEDCKTEENFNSLTSEEKDNQKSRSAQREKHSPTAQNSSNYRRVMSQQEVINWSEVCPSMTGETNLDCHETDKAQKDSNSSSFHIYTSCNNNNTKVSDSDIDPNDIPTGDITTEQLFEIVQDDIVETSNSEQFSASTESLPHIITSSENRVVPVTRRTFTDEPRESSSFNRFFSIGTFVSLSICAVGIIVTIITSRR